MALKGRRVLVTAGAAGIGRVIAETFIKAGARVQVCDVDEKALKELKRKAPAVAQTLADVADLLQVEKLFEEVKRNLGGLDILVNNAGIAGPTGKVEDIRPEDWDRCIAIDLNGMFYCTRKAMPMIKSAGGGSIINLSSIAGRLAFPMRTPYSAAKWAVVGFTQSLAAEAGPDGVRVNCIQPGIVEGDRVERIMAALEFQKKKFAIEWWRGLVSKPPSLHRTWPTRRCSLPPTRESTFPVRQFRCVVA